MLDHENDTRITRHQPDASRRRLLTGVLAGIGGSVLLAATGSAAGAAEVLATGRGTHPTAFGRSSTTGKVGGSAVHNAGAGMHVGPDTAMGISTFTLSATAVCCGVGSLGNSPGAVPGTAAFPTGLATSGPFAMMMYATKIDSYSIDRTKHGITAKGQMRSITAVGSMVYEDVEHPFIAQGFDGRGTRPDEFFLHFTTPFWNATNPMATKSTLNSAWAMFGSPILFGEVNVI